MYNFLQNHTIYHNLYLDTYIKCIKKYLKKKPMEEWKSALEKLMMHTAVPQASIEVGVFIIGKNQYVDKLVFKCGSFEQVPGFSYTFVMGKKLKRDRRAIWM